MHIYDLAETWFSEYQKIQKKPNNFPFKLESEKVGIKNRGLNEYAYLWAQKNQKSIVEVAEHFKLSFNQQCYLSKWIRKNNLKKLKHGASRKQTKTTRPRSEVNALCKQAYEELKNGITQTQVCIKYKISALSLQRYIKKQHEKQLI